MSFGLSSCYSSSCSSCSSCCCSWCTFFFCSSVEKFWRLWMIYILLSKSVMLTPEFVLHQDKDFVFVTIRAPYVKVWASSDCCMGYVAAFGCVIPRFIFVHVALSVRIRPHQFYFIQNTVFRRFSFLFFFLLFLGCCFPPPPPFLNMPWVTNSLITCNLVEFYRLNYRRFQKLTG